MKTRVGLFGGSFNPIHNGHTQLGKALCDKGLVDELWFLVSPLNPLKQQNKDELLPDNVRLRLVELATSNDERLKASDFEMHLPIPSYMVHTLEALRDAYSDKEFILVIGADNWELFPQWYKPDEILAHHAVIIYPRPGYEVNKETLPNGVTITDTPLLDISSTHIRQSIAEGTFQGEGLSPLVWKEIKEKGYYQ